MPLTRTVAVASLIILLGCGERDENAPLVKGTVVNAETGGPVTDFQVALKPGKPHGEGLWETELRLRVGSLFERLNPFEPRYFAAYGSCPDFLGIDDNLGEFEMHEIEMAPSNQDVDCATLFVRAPGFAIARETVGVPQRGELTVRLRPSDGIKGHVVGPDGEPVAGAWIFGGTLSSMSCHAPSHRGKPLVVSEADGTFVCPGLPEEVTFLTASHPELACGYAEIECGADDQPRAEFHLGKGAKLNGKLTRQGVPLPQQTVKVTGRTRSGLEWLDVSTHTAGSGGYDFERLPSGAVRVSHMMWRQHLILGEGETTTQDIDL